MEYNTPTTASASAPPQYTLDPSPQSAVNPGVHQCPDSPQQAFRNLAHLDCLFPAFPRLGKLDFSTNARHFPQLAYVASALRAFRISRKHSAYAQTNRPKLWSRCALAATSVWVRSTFPKLLPEPAP
ncbi:hypothetical protein PGT21_029882 [Puccinia graminis f. sp. tritici]|uniref:Uncharacterized protein n=1 Tax=Puccinia graminis f. sp. tritici TaxID=56615 RepID=A0A5B0NE95_PUCGR|nr:hypothetical protein PGTUg99_014942 [Puccinia graminis f. sp. tritici]KAA1104688.1 hypothetical protein PGT21_029882 [Puccinia graminis f. sp. tritici]